MWSVSPASYNFYEHTLRKLNINRSLIPSSLALVIISLSISLPPTSSLVLFRSGLCLLLRALPLLLLALASTIVTPPQSASLFLRESRLLTASRKF